MIWHQETELPPVGLIVIPGGFSYGDYLRPGAMAAHAPIMPALRRAASRGVQILGICNGFQILTEAGLLPGGLIPNAGLKFVSRTVRLRVEAVSGPYGRVYQPGRRLSLPVAHGGGNYVADTTTLSRLEGEGQILLRYADGDNPNGSLNDIAGIVDRSGRILGLMPHPECAVEPVHTSTDGLALFQKAL